MNLKYPQNVHLGLIKKLIIGVLYRAPGSDMSLFNEKMKDILDSIDDNDTYCYIMGDYNIKLLNYDTHIHTSDLWI